MKRTQRGLTSLMVGLMACALLVATTAWASAPKSYILKHPKREHCKAHYVKKVERVKKREHGKLVRVKETFCVYQAPKPTPTPTSPAPTPSPTPGPTPPPAPTEPTPSPTVGSLGINSSKGGSEGDLILTPHITSGGQPVPITCIGAERNISLSFYGHEIVDYVRANCEYVFNWATPEAGQFAFWQGEFNYAYEHEHGHIWRFTTREEVERGEVLVGVTYTGGPSYAPSTTFVPLVFMP